MNRALSNEKRIGIAVALAAMLMFFAACMFPAETSAASVVAKVNGKEYTNYEDAWEAVKNGGTIEMTADWKTSSWLKVPENVEITLNMNNYTIDRGLFKWSNEKFEKGALQTGEDKADGSVIYVGKNATLNIHDGTITGGASDEKAGGIHMMEKTKVNLYNVNVAGNLAAERRKRRGNGGGISLDGKNAFLYVKDSHIDNNVAQADGGGIYICDNSGCTVELDGTSTIRGNSSGCDFHAETNGYTTYGNGSGIYINGEDATITGAVDENGNPTCNISGNICGDEGGGIYINDEPSTIENLNISDNKAGTHGGGIFIADDKAQIKNCIINNNLAGGHGGGIYVQDEEIVIDACTIKGNSSDEVIFDGGHGGGIYICNDDCKIKDTVITGNHAAKKSGGVLVRYSVDVGLEGNVVIKDNFVGDKDSNLHLEKFGAQKAYIKDPSKVTSEAGSIGITSGNPTDKRRLSAKSGDYNASIFFSDNSKYVVHWEGNGDKLLKLRSVDKVVSVSAADTEGTAALTETDDPYADYIDQTENEYDPDMEAGIYETTGESCSCGYLFTVEEIAEAIDAQAENAIGADALPEADDEAGRTEDTITGESMPETVSMICPYCGDDVDISIAGNVELEHMILDFDKKRGAELTGLILGSGNMYIIVVGLVLITALGAGAFVYRRNSRKS